MIADLEFTGIWRTYQARILDDVDACLEDGRLHVVAAPGSGKTILGLEVMRRIGRPALVLAPTITIRNQWTDRLCRSFLPDDTARPDWVSESLGAPEQLTICTYQALHAAWAGRARAGDAAETYDADEDGPDAEPRATGEPAAFAALAQRLADMGPITIMLDEAHHLRREWWRALQDLIAALDQPIIVSLTATPPYDVEPAEWRRYEQVCGPVDAEIAIPDLVRHGDLCPHQDYLHVSMPTASEGELIAERRDGLARLFNGLLADPAFVDGIAGHVWITDPAADEQAILDAPEFLSAMLIFLHAAGRKVPRAPLKLLGTRRSEMPAMAPRWMEILLEGILAGQRDGFDLGPALKALRTDLQRLGAIEGGHVRIRESAALFKMIANSSAKLGSIVAIARSEALSLGDRLRMVVLTDFVRASDLAGGAASTAPAKLGVASIFDALRRAGIAARLGVLSGTLVIVPEAALEEFKVEATRCGLAARALRASPLLECPGYLRVSLGGADNHRIVDIMTRLFARGTINVLTGTQALLGEGWDAPSINSLVLASNVGSYMLSNQMRGRAIRTDPADPGKVANIWHLATIVPEATDIVSKLRRGVTFVDDLPDSDPVGVALGPDMELLKRRFRTFAGVDCDTSDAIESGMTRLRLQGLRWDAASVAALDTATLARAGDRATVAAKWRVAIGDAENGRTMRQGARPNYAPRRLALADTLQYLALTGLGGAIGSAAGAMRQFSNVSAIGPLLLIFSGLILLYALPNLAKAAYLLVRNGSLEGSIAQVARALLEGLEKAGLLSGPADAYAVEVTRMLKGERLVTLRGADRITEKLFLQALAEILGPVQNPRYLLVRESWLGRTLRVDFHAVPGVLGQRKELAEYFARRWKIRVGGAKLVFTRSGNGRHVLLRARARSLAAGFQRAIDTVSAWQ
ncbi:MAG: DEAD/DEAH box helicase family protein [Sphingomonas sp.]